MASQNFNKLIDFTLEVTNGCQFDCTGCNVDKEGNSWPTDEEFKKLENLVDDLNLNGFPAMNLALGPTDIMTSINKETILSSVNIQRLSNKFLKTVINCAFLDPFDQNYIELGKKLNWLLKGKMVKFVIPFECYHIDNKPYIERIRRRRDLVLENMPDVLHTKTYLIINYDASEIYDKENKTNLTEELLLKIYESSLLGDFVADLLLTQTRKDLNIKTNSDKFLSSVKKLNEVLKKSKEKYGERVNIAELISEEGKDWDIIYKAGKLYMTPFLLEGLTSFDERFEVSGSWTFENLYQYYTKNIIQQLEWTKTATECSLCNFTGLCAERGIHTLMQINKTTNCISPIKALNRDIIWK
jgi:hypothetical protein